MLVQQTFSRLITVVLFLQFVNFFLFLFLFDPVIFLLIMVAHIRRGGRPPLKFQVYIKSSKKYGTMNLIRIFEITISVNLFISLFRSRIYLQRLVVGR